MGRRSHAEHRARKLLEDVIEGPQAAEVLRHLERLVGAQRKALAAALTAFDVSVGAKRPKQRA